MQIRKFFNYISLLTITTVLLVPMTFEPETFAAEHFVKQSNELMPNGMKSVNDITIHAVFQIKGDSYEVDTFGYFKQINGFVQNEPIQFILEGVIGEDKAMLYTVADMQHIYGNDRSSNFFSDFNADIYLKKGDMPIRKFNYSQCNIINYYINTHYDTLFSYQQNDGIAIVDVFTIQCDGYRPYNAYYEYMKNQDRLDLEKQSRVHSQHDDKNIETWQDYFK